MIKANSPAGAGIAAHAFRNYGVILAIAAAACVVWFSPYAFPSSNNVYHVPIVLGYASSAEGPHDAFHQSLANFSSFFWPAVALVATEDNVQSLFLVLRIVASIATVLGAYALARAGGATSRVAGAGCGVLAFALGARQFFEFGNGELLSGFLTHSQMATAFCLVALALAVRRRWILAACLCGCAANINLFLAFWTMANLALARVIYAWQAEKKVPFADVASMAAACLVAASPAVIWALRSATGGEHDFSFTEFLYLFEPLHSFSHVQWGPLFNFATLPGVLWLCFREQGSSRETSLLVLLAGSSALVVFFGAVLAYLVEHRLLHTLHPLRYASVSHWIAAVAVVALWSEAEVRNVPRAVTGAIAVLGFALPSPSVTLLGLLFLMGDFKRLSRGSAAILIALGGSLMVPAFNDQRGDIVEAARIGIVPIVTLVSVVGSVLFAGLRSDTPWLQRVLMALLLWLVTMTTLLAGSLFTVPFALLAVAMAALLNTGQAQSITTVLGAVGAVGLIAHTVLNTGFSEIVVGTLIIIALALLAIRLISFRPQWSPATSISGVVVALSIGGLVKGAGQDFDFPRWPMRDSWVAAQSWARANTPPDTLFFSPERGDFSTLSRRPVWWDYKQGAAVMWEPAFYAEWNRRRVLSKGIKDSTQLIELAHAEGIRFLVLDKARLENDPLPETDVRYCNPDFCITEVRHRI